MAPWAGRFLRQNRWLILCGVGIELCLLYLVSLGDLRAHVPRFWLGAFPAFLAYGLGVIVVLKRPSGSLRFILLTAALFRATMWWSPPTLSEDVFRYVWDGRVQLAGVNPYRYPPAAPELAHLRDPIHAGINHKEIPTIYPPVAQLFFYLVAAVRPTPGAMRLGLLLAECGALLLLVRILNQRREDPCRVLLYAWNPLGPVEIAGGGHIDALGVFFLLLALHWLTTGRRWAAVWALSAAFLSKLVPVLALPVFGWRLAGRWPLLWFPVLSALGYWWFADAGAQLFSGLATYLARWRFNDSLFSVVYHVLRDPGTGWDATALLHTKLICAALLVLAVGLATARCSDPFRAVFAILGAHLLLAPTLHPWYLLWILPFLALFPSPAWLLLSGLVFLAYDVLIDYSRTGAWVEQDWVKWAQYGPFYLLLALSQARRLFHHLGRPSHQPAA